MTAAASALHLPYVYLQSAGRISSAAMAVFNSRAFHRLSKLKLLAVRNVLALGLDAVLLDADLVFCRDVRPFLRREVMLEGMKGPRPHVIIQNNLPRESKTRCGFNTGFYLARSSKGTVELFDRLVAESESKLGTGKDDQMLVHELMCNHYTSGPKEGKCMSRLPVNYERTRCMWKKKGVVAQALPIADFPNGKRNVWRTGANDTMKEACEAGRFAMMHVNYRLGVTKQPYLKENGLWLLTNDASNIGRCDNFSDVKA